MKLHDDQCDDELPAALAMLAEQLREDASRLAASYPPSARVLGGESTPQNHGCRSPAKAKWFTRRSGGMAGALLIACSLAALYSSSNRRDVAPLAPQVDHHSTLAVASGSRRAELLPAGQPGVGMVEASLLLDESGFERLSRPAQEAVLDLFEDDVLAQGKLSI